MTDAWPRFLEAMAAPDQPATMFAELQRLFRARVEARLFTVMAYDASTRMSRRVHTSDADHYPLAGSKPLSVGVWSKTVIEEKRPFVANTIEAIAEVFPDHELIRSLGCESVVNLPAVYAGEVIGCVNLLDGRGCYSEERVRAIVELAPFALAALLAARISTT